MRIKPLADDLIIIGEFTGDKANIIGSIDTIDPASKKNCSLWTPALAANGTLGLRELIATALQG
jgi:hypothetical protein